MNVSVIRWLTAALVLSAFVALGLASPCRTDIVAGLYDGYTCELTEVGVGSIPTNSTAIRMLSTEAPRHTRGNLTLPRLLVLKVLEYDVTRGLDVSERPFVQLPDLETLQLFHRVSSADDFRLVLHAGVFEGLNGLKRLILSDLGLDDLPIGVLDGLDNLRILELNQNRLSQIQAGTFTACCQTLSVLTLSRNQISDLGLVSRHSLSGLRTLDLSGNKLTALNELDFAEFVNIVNIDLANNEISRIDEQTLRGLSKLESLHLNRNRLSLSDEDSVPNTISPNQNQGTCRGPFCGLSSLQTLDISDNNISCLPNFQELVSLRKLDVSGNKIDSLLYEQFVCLRSLEDLDLSQNHITTLSRAFRGYFNRLEWIDVSSNPWQCDCDVYWLAEWLIRTTDKSNIEVDNLQSTQCATPVPHQLLTEAYVNNSAECGSGFDEDTAHETTETVWSAIETDDGNTRATGHSLPDPENIMLSSEQDTASDGDHISTESTHDLHFTSEDSESREVIGSTNTIFPSTESTPQTMLYSVTEDIRTMDDLLVTGIANLDQMKTCDMLLSSVTENMKTLDSLLQTTTANIDKLNSMLLTTIGNLESADIQQRTLTESPLANGHRSNSLSLTNRPNAAFQLLMLLTVNGFVQLVGCK